MTLQIYILRQLLIAIFFALAGIAVMVLPAITIQAIHRLEGVAIQYLFQYVPLVVVELVPYLLPMGFLLGVVATFGRLAADNEWTAIRMAGINPMTLLLPGLLIALLCSIGTHWLIATVTPEWKFAQRSLLRLAKEDAYKSLGRGRTEFQIGDFFLSCARRDENVFHEVIISIPRPAANGQGGDDVVIVADAVAIEFPEDAYAMDVYFSNARTLQENEDYFNERPFVRYPLDEIVSRTPKQKERPKYMTNAELWERLEGSGSKQSRKELDAAEREDYLYAIHSRLALSVTYFLFLLLGSSTGLWLRRGTQLAAFTVAVGYAFLYYVLSMRLGKELARIGVIGPIFAAWTTNALFLAVGVGLLRKVFRW